MSNETIQAKIKQLITTVQNNLRDLSPQQRTQLYKDFAEFLKHEGDSSNQDYLQHYPILQEDFSAESLFKTLNIKIDLDDNGTSDNTQQYITGLLNDKKYEKIWNESVANLLSKLDELINDTKNIAGVWKQSDAKNANAGRSFNSESNISPVIPEKNIDKKTYLNIRGNDAIKDALYNKSNLQFTHSQSNDNPINKYIRLLIDKYTRNVEVEDLNRNFWVIGQTISIISAFLLDEDSCIKQLFKYISSETVQLWENILYLWASAAVLCQHQNYETHAEIIYLPNNNQQNYRKFDNFNYSLDGKTREEIIENLRSRCSAYKFKYPKNSLIILPIIRIGNHFTNYYSTEVYYGYYKYDRATGNESFEAFNTPVIIKISDFNLYLYHFWNDKNGRKYYFKFGTAPKKDDQKKDFFEQYCLRVTPTINLYQGNFQSLTLKLVDPIREIVGDDKAMLKTVIITKDNTPSITPISPVPSHQSTLVEKTYEEIFNMNNKGFYLGELLSNGSQVNIIIDRDIETVNKYFRPISPSKFQIETLTENGTSTQSMTPSDFFINNNSNSNLYKEDQNIIRNEINNLKNSTSTEKIEYIIYGHPSFLSPYNREDIQWEDISPNLQNILLPTSSLDGYLDNETGNEYRIWETDGSRSEKFIRYDSPILRDAYGGENKFYDYVYGTSTHEGIVIDPNDPSSGPTNSPKTSTAIYNLWESSHIPIYHGYLTHDPCAILYVDNGDIHFNPGAYGKWRQRPEDEEKGIGPDNPLLWFADGNQPRFFETHETIYKNILVKIPIKNSNKIYKIPYNCIRNSTLQAQIMTGLEFKPELENGQLVLTNYVSAGHRVREYSNIQLLQNNTNKKKWCIKATHIVSEFGPNIKGAFIHDTHAGSGDICKKLAWINIPNQGEDWKEYYVEENWGQEANPTRNFITHSETTNKRVIVPQRYQGDLQWLKNNGEVGWSQYDKNNNKSDYSNYTSEFMPICYYGWNIYNTQGVPVWDDTTPIENNNTTTWDSALDNYLFENILKNCYNYGLYTEESYPYLIAKPTLWAEKTGYLVADRLNKNGMGDPLNGRFKYTEAISSDINKAINNNTTIEWQDNPDTLSIGQYYADSGQEKFYGFTNMVLTTYLFFNEDNENDYASGFCWLKRVNTDRTLNIVNYEGSNNYYLSWNKSWEKYLNNGQTFFNTQSPTQLDFEQELQNYTLKKIDKDFVNNNNELVFDFSKYPSNGICACDLLEPSDNGYGIYDAPTGNIEPQHS